MTTAQFDADLAAASLQAASSGGACVGAAYSEAPAPPPRTLWKILAATAERFPRAIAIDDGRSVLDYLGLLRQVRRVGDRLTSLGIGGGDRVGIRVSSGTAELYLSILAVLSVGADLTHPGFQRRPLRHRPGRRGLRRRGVAPPRPRPGWFGAFAGPAPSSLAR